MSEVRGVGHTTAQLVAAPDTFTFVVHTAGMYGYARMLLQKHCPDKIVTIIGVNRIDITRGQNVPIIVDHAAEPKLSDSDRNAIRSVNERCGYEPPPASGG